MGSYNRPTNGIKRAAALLIWIFDSAISVTCRINPMI